MEDFFLPEFTFDHFDFDLSVYVDDLVSDPEIQITQNTEASHDRHVIDHQSRLDFSCERPAKKTEIIQSWNSCSSSSITKPSQLISFELSNPSPCTARNDVDVDFDIDVERHGGSRRRSGQGTKTKACNSRVRSSILANDHVLAERKRREKLSESFIALSALLPGLKKADKATVLGNAIAHLKELQERVKELEKEKEASREIESMILVKKSKIFHGHDHDDHETHSSSSLSDEDLDQTLPEIEVRACREDVLIRIHCEKGKGCMVTILKEIEKLHLSVMNSIVLPFGDSTLDITVLAKKEEDFCLTVKDLVKNVRLAYYTV